MNAQDPRSSADDPDRNDRAPRRLTAWQVLASTVAAAFGVQSSRNRERDFTLGRPSHFIVAGIVFTLLFVLGMILLVNLVLSGAV